MSIVIHTIGFARKSAAEFFGLLKRAGIRRLIDIRLHNTSQLAGYAKKEDLAYFLKELCDADYVHQLLLAPSEELFDAYKREKGSWADYEREFRKLLAKRHVEDKLDRRLFDRPAVLLCSEPTAEHCHRRLVVEYLNEKWGDVEGVHL